MTSLIRENSLRFIVEPEFIPNIPNEVGAEQLIVGENASIALEVLGAQGRDVWIFSIACLLKDGLEHPAFRVIKHDQRLVAVERSFNSIYLMKSGVTVKRIKPQEKQCEEDCLILKFEVFVSGCECPLTLTSSNIFVKSPSHFTPEIYDVRPRNAVPDGNSFMILNMNYGKYKNLKKRVFANFNDNHGWTYRCEAELRHKTVTGIEYKVPIPKYTKSLHKDMDIMVTIESHLFKQSKKKIKNSKPFSISFFVSKDRKRTVEKIVDYREYSTDEDNDRENKDDNTRRGRKKSTSRSVTKSRNRAQSDCTKKRSRTTSSEEDSQSKSGNLEEDVDINGYLNLIGRSVTKSRSRAQSDCTKKRSRTTSSKEDSQSKSGNSEEDVDINDYLNLIGNATLTNNDILELIRMLNLNVYDFNIDDLRDAFEDTTNQNSIRFDQYSTKQEQEDFEEILASMHAFSEDLSDLLDLSSISEEKEYKKVNYDEKCPLLSEHEMNKIIMELQEDYKEDLKQTFDIHEDDSYNWATKENNQILSSKDEIYLIEETLKTMALELPKPFDSQAMEFEESSPELISC